MSTASHDSTAPDSERGPAPDGSRAAIADETAALRDAFESGRTRSIRARLDQLDALRRALRSERRRLTSALEQDLGKGRIDSAITELGVVTQEIAHTSRHLRSWLAPEKLTLGAMLAPSGGRLIREPLGLTLIIAPWNYPLNLTLSPLVAAIAGGNTVIVKPSEVAPATSAALAHLIRTHLDPDWVRVVEGAVEETTALLEQRFDLIFYTGNGTVGRIVARAAAEHLTPTILELGGKSPLFVDQGVDLERAARRIVWGKFSNTGQTCVAPDYLMATAQTVEELLPHLRRGVRGVYGPDPRRRRAPDPDDPRAGRQVAAVRRSGRGPGAGSPPDRVGQVLQHRPDLRGPRLPDGHRQDGRGAAPAPAARRPRALRPRSPPLRGLRAHDQRQALRPGGRPDRRRPGGSGRHPRLRRRLRRGSGLALSAADDHDRRGLDRSGDGRGSLRARPGDPDRRRPGRGHRPHPRAGQAADGLCVHRGP